MGEWVVLCFSKNMDWTEVERSDDLWQLHEKYSAEPDVLFLPDKVDAERRYSPIDREFLNAVNANRILSVSDNSVFDPLDMNGSNEISRSANRDQPVGAHEIALGSRYFTVSREDVC